MQSRTGEYISNNEQCRFATLIAADQIISRNFEGIIFLIIGEKTAVRLVGTECPLQIAVLEWFVKVAPEFLHGEHPVLIQKPQCCFLNTVVLGIIFFQREFCPVGDSGQHQSHRHKSCLKSGGMSPDIIRRELFNEVARHTVFPADAKSCKSELWNNHSVG